MRLGIVLLLSFCLPAIAEISNETRTQAEAGDAAAQYEVGRYYLKESKEENHVRIAKNWFEKSAKQKYAPSLFEFGYLTMASNEENSVPQGVALMNLAADMGYAEAQYQIGLIHGMRGEFTESADLFERAAKQEHTQAMVLLADYYENGLAVSKDPKKATELINHALELGSLPAKNWLGKKYAEGRGVKKDPKKAFELYSATAALNDAEGQHLLAHCYRTGFGTKKNYNESVRLARLAMQQHNIEAAGDLGANYLTGYGVKKIPALGYALTKYCGKTCNAEMRLKILIQLNEISEPDQIVGDRLNERMRRETDILSIVDEYEKAN
ncbi:MAG TPA: tetratricopeptide repeat protein [Cellvibrio sp.]|nr:tetratricopeptide repeat protein [Cellvibrio sp.]